MFNRLKPFSAVLKDPNKKNGLKMMLECLHYGWIKKELPIDYFRKFLYRKDIVDYSQYLSLKQYYAIIYNPKIRHKEIASILDNKLSFALYSKTNNIPTPLLISYNLRDSFFFNGNMTIINCKEALIPYFENILNSIPNQGIFLKPIESSGGSGCFTLRKESIKNQLDLYGDALLNNSYIHQEIIQQHEDINKIHPKSINTLRIDTYIDKNKKSHILSVLMRFGVGNSIIDNSCSGGFSISVNLLTGKLQGIGRQVLPKGGNTYLNHPDSKMILENFKVPFFEEACKLVIETSYILPTRLIGWDIAITQSGPVIVEGNEGPALHLTDVAFGGYCKHPIIQDILSEIKA